MKLSILMMLLSLGLFTSCASDRDDDLVVEEQREELGIEDEGFYSDEAMGGDEGLYDDNDGLYEEPGLLE